MLQKHLKNCFRLIRKSTKKFRKFFEKIQLTCLYFLSTSILMYSIKNALGFFPSIFLKLIPFSGQILNCELLKLLANPERTFIFYLLILFLYCILLVNNFLPILLSFKSINKPFLNIHMKL